MKSQILALFLAIAAGATAFAPSAPAAARIAPSPAASNTALRAAATVPNPFKKLPWVAEKERQREARRLKLERAKLHGLLRIVEDASYEEIVIATDNLIAAAGNDIKQKIQIEVAKDKILQIRLNERLAGLATTSKDARAQSSFEQEGYVYNCVYVCVCCANILVWLSSLLCLPCLNILDWIGSSFSATPVGVYGVPFISLEGQYLIHFASVTSVLFYDNLKF